MNSGPEKRKEEALAGATAALRRAAQRARLLARRTGTPLVILGKDGRVEKRWLAGDADAQRREDFDEYLAAVPDVAPAENDRLD